MDQILFKWINQLAGNNSVIDEIMIFASKKFRYIFALVIFFMWFRNRTYKKVVIQAVLSVIINIGINQLIKKNTYRPRPFITRNVNMLIPSMHDSTITSKHTLLTFAVATSIYMYNRILGLIMLVLSVLTGASRIWTGAHYPSDVARSAFIGSMVSIIVNKISMVIR